MLKNVLKIGWRKMNTLCVIFIQFPLYVFYYYYYSLCQHIHDLYNYIGNVILYNCDKQQ